MYLWDQILQLSEEKQKVVSTYYRSPYSIEVRHVLAYWIEDTFRASNNLDSKDPKDVPTIKRIISNLIDELQMKADSQAIYNSRDIRETIGHYVTNIRFHFPENAVGLFEHIRQCLQQEYEFLPYHRKLIDPKQFNWNIFGRVQTCQQEIRAIFDQWRGLEGQGHVPIPTQPGVTGYTLEARMTELIPVLESLDNGFEEKFEAYSGELHVQLSVISLKIQNWKDERQKSVQGKLKNRPIVELRDLQIHCEFGANRLWCLRELLKKMSSLNANRPDFLKRSADLHAQKIRKFQQIVCEKLISLVSESFIIAVQPSKITKVDTKGKGPDDVKNASPSLQLLVGKQIRARPPITVYCYLLDEKQALEIVGNKSNLPKHLCKAENKFAEFQTTKEGAYCAQFRNKLLPEHISRLSKKKDSGIKRVSDENNWFYYWAEFTVEDILFKISEFSYPVKIFTNASQEADFWEAAIWDISAGRFGVESVTTRPDEVLWKDFGSAVSAWFERLTGRGLTDGQLLTIATKMLSPSYGASVQYNPLTRLSWGQLKTNISYSETFTFCKWIYANMKLIEDHLGDQKKGDLVKPGLWRAGAAGFPTEAESAQLLAGRPDGSFLIRFSYTTPGALTIDFLEDGVLKSNRNTIYELKCRSLLNRISDIPNWQFLYPDNISKEELLQKYFLPADTAILAKGYVKAGIVARLESNG